MKLEKNKDTLILYFEGELSSSNAEAVEKEANSLLEKEEFNKLILNFSHLRYISSAGLRVVLRLKQNYNDVEVVEASLEVYDTFSMTGFTDIMTIRKALTQVDISNAEVIGDGYFSTVYRINGDTIIKVFERTSDENQIERELKLAKQAFVLGIPTAIAFDVVKVGEKLGVRFEMLDCMSLKGAYLSHPEKRQYYLQKYADLLKQITSTECNSPDIPRTIDIYKKKLEFIKPFIDSVTYEKMDSILNKLEKRNTLVHGDCHFKNIMVQGDELLLIDMDTLSIGHPIFEYAAIYATYVAFEQDEPGNCKKFLGIEASDAAKLFDALIEKNFGKDKEQIIEKISLISNFHMVWWTKVNQPENNVRFEGSKARLLSLLDKYDDVNF